MLLFITIATKQKKNVGDVTSFFFVFGSSTLSLNSSLIINSWNEIQKVQFGWSVPSWIRSVIQQMWLMVRRCRKQVSEKHICKVFAGVPLFTFSLLGPFPSSSMTSLYVLISSPVPCTCCVVVAEQIITRCAASAAAKDLLWPGRDFSFCQMLMPPHVREKPKGCWQLPALGWDAGQGLEAGSGRRWGLGPFICIPTLEED